MLYRCCAVNNRTLIVALVACSLLIYLSYIFNSCNLVSSISITFRRGDGSGVSPAPATLPTPPIAAAHRMQHISAPVHVNDSKYRFFRKGLTFNRLLPTALIIGVKKCGTRALLEFIRLHPDVRTAGSEVHFFDRHYSKGINWYRRQMPSTVDGQITMEKTPSYFITERVPKRVYHMNPRTKLLIVVRDPVTRAISDYTQAASKKKHVKRFEELAFINGTLGVVDTKWGPVRIGIYARYLKRWLKYFPLSQLLFISGERLIVDPAAEIGKVQDFLGLKRVITEKHFYFNSTKGFPCLMKSETKSTPRCLGKTKGRSHAQVNEVALERLRQFYRPFNQKFYALCGLDFGWP